MDGTSSKDRQDQSNWTAGSGTGPGGVSEADKPRARASWIRGTGNNTDTSNTAAPAQPQRNDSGSNVFVRQPRGPNSESSDGSTSTGGGAGDTGGAGGAGGADGAVAPILPTMPDEEPLPEKKHRGVVGDGVKEAVLVVEAENHWGPAAVGVPVAVAAVAAAEHGRRKGAPPEKRGAPGAGVRIDPIEAEGEAVAAAGDVVQVRMVEAVLMRDQTGETLNLARLKVAAEAAEREADSHQAGGDIPGREIKARVKVKETKTAKPKATKTAKSKARANLDEDEVEDGVEEEVGAKMKEDDGKDLENLAVQLGSIGNSRSKQKTARRSRSRSRSSSSRVSRRSRSCRGGQMNFGSTACLLCTRDSRTHPWTFIPKKIFKTGGMCGPPQPLK